MTLKDEFYEMRKQEKIDDAQRKLKENLEKKDPLTERREEASTSASDAAQ